MMDDTDDADDTKKKRKGKSDEDLLTEAKDAFKRAAEAEEDNRTDGLDDLKFARLGEQWPDQILKERNSENRPALTINRLPAFIRQVVNDARQNKPSIQVHPVDSSGDPEIAKIMDGLIRNIEYSSSADVAYDTATENAVTCGFGYFRINVDYAHDDSFDQDILIERIINPFTVYGDPDSEAADSSDWNVCFVTTMMTKDAFAAKYKGAEKVDWEDLGYGKAKDQDWIGEDSIRVAEWWTREEVARKVYQLTDGQVVDDKRMKDPEFMAYMQAMGITVKQERDTRSWKVTQRVVTGAEILSTTEWAGKYIPIVPVYGDEVVVEGKRYFRSLIRDAKDPQRNFNYWRTTATELVALAPKAPWIGPKGAFNTDMKRWRTANTKSHPFLEYDGQVPPQRQPFAGVPAGALQEAMNASDDMKSVMGLFDASLGAKSNETSGRAILARQREGDVSTFHFQDNMTRAIRHAGRILIDLIPKVYNGPRILRILGPDNVPQSQPVNQPVPVQGPDGQPMTNPVTGDPVTKVYDLTAGRYDLTVKAGPSFTTRREEAAYQMTELMRAFPAAAPVVGPELARNLDWPGADEIAKKLEAMTAPKEPQPTPQDQIKAQEIAQKGKTEEARMALEAANVHVDSYRAETERMTAVAPAMSPEMVQAIVVQTVRDILSGGMPG